MRIGNMLILPLRSVTILTVLLLILSIVLSPSKALAGEGQDLSLNVQVNDLDVVFPDARPYIDNNGRTQAPARFVAQALGAEVNWNSGAATFSRNGKEIVLVPGSSTATVNGAPVKLDSGAVLIGDRIYTPMRFIAETMGAVVQWDANARTVKITMGQPVIKDFDITHTEVNAGWYTIPRTFTAWVEADNTQKVDFYLTPTGTGQAPVKIATSYGSNGHFSITYRLPQASTMSHFWAVAINEQEERSTDILNVYRDAAGDTDRESIGFGDLSLYGYGQDLLFRPGGGRAIFSGLTYQDEENKGNNNKLLLLDLAVGAVNMLDEGEFIRAIGWDSAGENVLYLKDGALYRLSMIDGRKNIIAEDTYYGTYSPAGQRIAFAQRNNGLWVCDSYGNDKERLTETAQDWYPVWYPDSQHLFYFSDLGQELGDGAGHLQGMAKISVTDGSIEAILPQKTGKFRSAEWIVPGCSLHVVSGWDDGYFQHIVDLTKGEITDLGENFGNINYVTALDTATGRLLKASSEGIQIYDGSGNLQKSIEHSLDGLLYLNAAFAPDGRSVLMMSGTQAGGQEPVKREIAVLNLESKTYKVVAEGGENFEACFQEPGSGQILILEKSAAGTSYELACFTKMGDMTGQ